MTLHDRRYFLAVRLRKKTDVLSCDAFHRIALFHVARFNYLVCQTVSDAGRILFL